MERYNFQRPGILARSLNLSFGEKEIFDNLHLEMIHGDKLVLVGENGIGKSTLLKALNGEFDEQDEDCRVSGTVGFLPQALENFSEDSVVELMAKKVTEPELKKVLNKYPSMDYEEWEQHFNAMGGYRFFINLNQLGMKNIDISSPMSSFSGGEKTKIYLGILSLISPSILLLDEPTNHLDRVGIQWLERFLKNHDGIIVMTTHDRMLIDRTATRIAEISPVTRNLIHFRGGYTNYLIEKKKEFERLKQKHLEQKAELEKLNSRLSDKKASPGKHVRVRSDNNKLSYNAHGQRSQKGQGRQIKQIKGKIEDIESNMVNVPKKGEEVSISLSNAAVQSESQIFARGLMVQFSNRTLFENLSFSVFPGERLIIQGKNGSGKTTLLRVLAGELYPNRGRVEFSYKGKIGYLDQEQESIDLMLTPVELLDSNPEIQLPTSTLFMRLKEFGIYRKEDLFTPLKLLSIGARRKAQLANIIFGGCDILLLDEPTNHLDLPSLEQIEEELLRFPGPVIAVSHDRFFSEKFATKKINLDK